MLATFSAQGLAHFRTRAERSGKNTGKITLKIIIMAKRITLRTDGDTPGLAICKTLSCALR